MLIQPLENDRLHPLYSADRRTADSVLASGSSPSDSHLTNCARLLIRHEDFPGSTGIVADLEAALKAWGLTRDQLNAKCRALWAAGYKPQPELEQAAVGSGADVTETT